MPERKRRILAMHGIASQIGSSGSVTTARTEQSSSGLFDARLKLGRDLFEYISTGVEDAGYLQVLDALAADKLGEAAASAVAALNIFQEEARDLADLAERLKLLNAIESNRAGSATRQVQECVVDLVEQHLREVRLALSRAFDSKPGGIAGAVEQCRLRVKDLVAADESVSSLRALKRLITRLRELPEFESTLTREAYAAVGPALLQAARAAFDEALSHLAARKATDALASRRSKLEATLTACESRGVFFNAKVRAVIEELAEQQQQVRTAEEALTSSLALQLPGADVERVLRGCCARAGCADLPTLVSKLAAELEVKLREHAVANHSYLDGANASLAGLITDLPADELTELFVETVNQTVCDDHSLYRAINAAGIEDCAERLWERAGPTCFGAAVQEYMFGLAPVEFTIIRLPTATNAIDQEIRDALRETFAERTRRPHFTDAKAGEEVLVTRVVNGYVIGVEDSNPALLQRYVDSGEGGHAPHLVDFFPDDSPYGEVISGVRDLAGHLQIETERDPDDDQDWNGRQETEKY